MPRTSKTITTYRLSGQPSGGITKRLTGAPSGGITKRVTAAPTANITKRLLGDVPFSTSVDLTLGAFTITGFDIGAQVSMAGADLSLGTFTITGFDIDATYSGEIFIAQETDLTDLFILEDDSGFFLAES